MRSIIGAIACAMVIGAMTTVRVAGRSSATAQITIRIHDYAHIGHDSVARTQLIVSRRFEQIGIEIIWARTLDHTNDQPVEPVHRSEPPEDLTVIVLRRPPDQMPVDPRALGFAPVDVDMRGRTAYVLYERVQLTALLSQCDPVPLVGLVIAHELGHLLLPHGSHSRDGIMRGDWAPRDLRNAAGTLGFSSQQGDLIRQSIQTRWPTLAATVALGIR